MVADADAGAADPMEDGEAWRDLSREEQSDMLDEGLDDLRGVSGDGDWRHLSDEKQRATVDAIERSDGGRPQRARSETERAMQAALDETWTAEIFADLDDVPTIPFECRELSSHEQDVIMDAFQAMQQLEDQAADLDEDEREAVAEDPGSLEFDAEHFNEPADLEDWVPELLGDVTVDDAFDAERFRTGERLRSNTRKLLFVEIVLRYEEEAENALKFRTE